MDAIRGIESTGAEANKLIYSECIVCRKIYDKKPDGNKKISYSHGYCSKECIKVSKELTKRKKSK
jgi:hypothetical protein